MIAPSKAQEARVVRSMAGLLVPRPARVDQRYGRFSRAMPDRDPGDAEILEVGPSAGNPTSTFLSSLWTVHGLDVDPSAARNGSLRSFHLLTGSSYPFADGAFGAVVSDYVVEHVESPSEHLREVFRVLVPGGVYALRTPNLFHYVAAVAAVTPHWFHTLVSGRLRGHKRGAHELFPTFYRLNTRHAIHQHSRDAGFRIRSLEMMEKEPSYAVASRALFVAGLTYKRFVNRFAALAQFRANIFAVLEKPAP